MGTNSKDETIDLGKSKRFKTLTCRSIDGSLTGATRCERILYADDLVSGIEEALSKDRLDNLWGKYTNDLKSRKSSDVRKSILPLDGQFMTLSADLNDNMRVIPVRSSLLSLLLMKTMRVILITLMV